MPSSNAALIDIVVGGAAHTDGVGRQRKVEVYTTADTKLAATKRLMFDGYRLTSSPAVAQACSHQHVHGVNVNRRFGRRLIGRFARRRAAKLRPCAEECANCQARQKLTRGMDSQTVERFAKSNQQLADLRARLREQEAFPEHLHVHSTNQEICMQATLRASGIFTAPGAPPEFNLDHDVLVQLHESAANNLLSTRIAGMKIDNQRIEQQMKELNLELPAPRRMSWPRVKRKMRTSPGRCNSTRSRRSRWISATAG